MSAAQIVALSACVLAVLCFMLSAGLFFVRPGATRREDPAGLNLVKLVGPLANLGLIYAVVVAPVSTLRAGIGAGLFLAAAALFVWAVRTNSRRPLTRIFSPDVPAHLVTVGPYRWLRHPCYSAYLLSFSAGLTVNPTYWLGAVALLMLVLYYQAARYEERKFKHSPLGQDYARYRESTGMFLPRP